MIVRRALTVSALLLAVYAKAVAQVNPAPAAEPPTLRYSYILAGQLAGAYERTAVDERSYKLRLQYTSASGTVSVETLIAFDPQWFPIKLQSSGRDALGHDETESFAVENGVAQWKNRNESGSAFASPMRFYSSETAPLEETRALVLAARSARDGCVELLPVGRACVRKALEDRISFGGVEQTVHAWAISGVGFRPIVVWLDEKSELFATVSAWASAIRVGWEQAEDTLLEKQEAWVAGELRRRAQELTRRPKGPFVIRNARLFDSATKEVRPGMSVLVDGTRIVRVGTDAELRDVVAEVIDARGAMLLPGLWDMHVHELPADGLLALASGITTVRSLAGRLEALTTMKAKFESGSVVGPRLFFNGLIDGRDGADVIAGELVSTREEAIAAVQRYAAAGADGIKIYSSVPPALVPVVVDEAHRQGLTVGGHVPSGMTARQVVDSGFDEVNHLWSIASTAQEGAPDANTREGKLEILRRVVAFDPASAPAQALFRTMRERHVVVDPTIGTFEDTLGLGGTVEGVDATHGTAVAAHLPPAVRRAASADHRFVGVEDATRTAAIQRLRSLLVELRKSGVQLVLGGDGLPGIALQREMAEWATAGVSNADILQAATLGNARAVGRDRSLGSIHPGKLADMILVDGDPLVHIRDIANVRLTIKDGAIYDAAGLLRAVGVQR